MMARVSDVILGLDPRITSGGDPRVKPEDDGINRDVIIRLDRMISWRRDPRVRPEDDGYRCQRNKGKAA
ncbi:hypothetical protein ACSSV8_001834 [Roseovarius sp. MBR-79]|jgi:hypothetical protein